MDTIRRRSHPAEAERPGPFRRYGWVLIVMAVILVLLCAGTGALEAASGSNSILARLRSEAGAGAPTFIIPARQELSLATMTPTATGPPSATPPPSDTPTSTATRPPTISVTCSCQGSNYVCSNGATTRNSSRCVPAATPVCGCQGHDWVCSDGTSSVNDIRCGVTCWCQGNDLYCNDGTVGMYNPECACTCVGTTMYCNDGGSQANAPFCKGNKKKK